MKKFWIILGIFATLAISGIFFAKTSYVAAWDPGLPDVEGGSEVQKDIASDGEAETKKIFGTVTNVLMFVLGSIAIISIIVGAIMMISAAGDPGKFAKGRNSVVYAVVGLVVAISAYAIINFVLSEL